MDLETGPENIRNVQSRVARTRLPFPVAFARGNIQFISTLASTPRITDYSAKARGRFICKLMPSRFAPAALVPGLQYRGAGPAG